MNKRQAKKKRNKSIYRDTWSLDYAIAKFTLPRLICFKKVNNGHPYTLTSQEWDEILDKMIIAFDFIANTGIWDTTPEQEKQIDEGLDLFRKYYFDLWW